MFSYILRSSQKPTTDSNLEMSSGDKYESSKSPINSFKLITEFRVLFLIKSKNAFFSYIVFITLLYSFDLSCISNPCFDKIYSIFSISSVVILESFNCCSYSFNCKIKSLSITLYSVHKKIIVVIYFLIILLFDLEMIFLITSSGLSLYASLKYFSRNINSFLISSCLQKNTISSITCV